MVRLRGGGRIGPWLAGAVCAAAMATAGPVAQTGQPSAARVADRLRALQREADELAAREKTLLVELRQLELQRQIKTEELAGIDTDLRRAEQDMASAQARAASLSDTTRAAGPDVEARMVRLYKMGRGGYWRLLLGSEDIRAVGRAYRTAAALSAIDRSRVQEHESMLKAPRPPPPGRRSTAQSLIAPPSWPASISAAISPRRWPQNSARPSSAWNVWLASLPPPLEQRTQRSGPHPHRGLLSGRSRGNCPGRRAVSSFSASAG
jgi:hypothetical protein